MLFSYVVEEGPAEEVLECNESENMDSNMCKTQSTCAFFEESVPAHLLQLIKILLFNQLILLSQILRPHGGLCSLKIMYWSPQIPEKNLFSSLKVFCHCSPIPKINSTSPPNLQK